MEFKENAEQLFGRQHRGIIDHLDHFRVAGQAGADVFVGWVFHLAVAVAADDGLHALDALEDDFDAPETSGAEGDGFHFFGGIGFGGGIGFRLRRFDRRRFRLVGAGDRKGKGGEQEEELFHGAKETRGKAGFFPLICLRQARVGIRRRGSVRPAPPPPAPGFRQGTPYHFTTRTARYCSLWVPYCDLTASLMAWNFSAKLPFAK